MESFFVRKCKFNTICIKKPVMDKIIIHYGLQDKESFTHGMRIPSLLVYGAIESIAPYI